MDKLEFVLFFSGIWCLVGLVFYLIGFFVKRSRENKRDRCTMTASGEVSSIRKRLSHGSGHSSTLYYPTVRYTAKGKEYEEERSYGASGCPFSVGDKVIVKYNPDDPSDFYLPEDGGLSVLGKVFTGIGLACFAVGIAAAVLILAD